MFALKFDVTVSTNVRNDPVIRHRVFLVLGRLRIPRGRELIYLCRLFHESAAISTERSLQMSDEFRMRFRDVSLKTSLPSTQSEAESAEPSLRSIRIPR